jgi:hypothetical protein
MMVGLYALYDPCMDGGICATVNATGTVAQRLFYVELPPPDSVLLDCHTDHWASIVDVLTLFHGLHDVIIVPDCTDYAVCAGA